MDLGTKLIVENATDAKTLANSASRQSESNGRHPGPGFGQKPGKQSLNLIWLSRARPGRFTNQKYPLNLQMQPAAIQEGPLCSESVKCLLVLGSRDSLRVPYS